jgi:hypothetical protein
VFGLKRRMLSCVIGIPAVCGDKRNIKNEIVFVERRKCYSFWGLLSVFVEHLLPLECTQSRQIKVIVFICLLCLAVVVVDLMIDADVVFMNISFGRHMTAPLA